MGVTKKKKALCWQFSMSDMNENMTLIDLQAHLPSSSLPADASIVKSTPSDLADMEQNLSSRPAAFITAANVSSGKECEEFYGPGLHNLTPFYLFSLSFIDSRFYFLLSHRLHSCLGSEWFLCPFASCFVGKKVLANVFFFLWLLLNWQYNHSFPVVPSRLNCLDSP